MVPGTKELLLAPTTNSLETIKLEAEEELESELVKIKIPKKSFIKEKIFEDLKEIFGKEIEILLNN
jgi:predicted HAD superfamily phosphohydrolase